MLKTGWGHWDKELNHLVGKKINILELGVYKGEAMQWFIDNLMTNKDTTYTGVDTFGGSPEYFIYNKEKIDMFIGVKKECFDRITKTDKKDQINIIIDTTKNALYDLYKKNKNNQTKYYDVIFIDASHEAIDVLSDCILSWNLLKEGGILINDDYYWDLLNQEHFRPKISIDSFINIYKSQCDVLHIGRQVLLRKKFKKDYELPRATKAVSLIKEICSQKIENQILQLPPKKKENLPFNLTFMNKPNYIYHMDNKNIIKKCEKLKENNREKKILQNSYFCGFFNNEIDIQFKNFYKKILGLKIYKSIEKFYILNSHKISITIFEMFRLINTNYKNKIFLKIQNPGIKEKSITSLRFIKKEKRLLLSKYIYNYIKTYKNKNISSFKSHIIYPLKETKELNIKNNNNISAINLNNLNNFNKHKLDNINIMDVDMYSRNILYYNNIYKNNDILFEYIYTSLFMVIFGLTYNSKLGCAYYSFLDIYMDISLQIIEIIRNYYEDVQIIDLAINNKLRNNNYFYIKAEKFRGIHKTELQNLKNILFEIKNKKQFFNLFDTNYFDKLYINQIKEYNDIYNNNLIKYLTFIDKLYNELNGKDISEFNISNIKKTLLQNQLDTFYKYLGNNKIINLI